MDNYIIIGVDGGASKVSAHIIEHDENGFQLGEVNSTKVYNDYPDYQINFTPVDLKTQLIEISKDSINLTKEEISQTKAYYSAFIDTISEVAKETNGNEFLIGIGMPGIKTDDGRGIVAMANGPRMPDFASEIEKRLIAKRIVLVSPIHKLGSDADYCGIGEEFADKGAFKAVENACYLGGGTGVADALKLNGKLVSFNECKNWISKTWEFKSKDGNSLEFYCSANGIQSLYGNLVGTPQNELKDKNIYIDQILKFAEQGKVEAIQCWNIVSDMLSQLIFERICTLFCGNQNGFGFLDQNHVILDKKHIFLGTLFDRVVIGQRLGEVFKIPSAQEFIIKPILNSLTKLIESSNCLNNAAKSHYLKDGKFSSNILVTSNLHEAPALGAGIDAWLNYDKS